ncbi:UDP-Glycosyltransferase superfamily protein [Striga asiatica]|uniref:UDP-Glycosyltransferase superfamily protein n=1 Tax=Striga asiatica TaxID=4170 RepID=A0A5A7PPG6_STRAF|nr:UDP-Glycosyltransferase superfamily protein [Striga asiatica]
MVDSEQWRPDGDFAAAWVCEGRHGAGEFGDIHGREQRRSDVGFTPAGERDGRHAEDGFGGRRDQRRGGDGNQHWESVFHVDEPFYDEPPVFYDEPFYVEPSVFDEEPPRPEDFIVKCNNTNKDCNQPFWGGSVHARGVGPAPIPVEDFSLHKLVDAIICMLHPEDRQSAIELAQAMENDDGGILTRYDNYFQVIDHSGGVEFFNFMMLGGVWCGSRGPMLCRSARGTTLVQHVWCGFEGEAFRT